MKRCLIALGVLSLMASAAWAQPVIDGRADVFYGDAIMEQDTQTGYGDAGDPARPDARKGRPDFCWGSELDQVFAAVHDGTLYLLLAGNLESNGNRLNLFFDSIPGQGQNTVLSDNPDKGGLLRMAADPNSADPNMPGLTFKDGFEADFFITLSLFEDFGDPNDLPTLFIDYARLSVPDANDPGEGYYLGSTYATCDDMDGMLVGGDANAPVIYATIDNRNLAGVEGGFGAGDGFGVLTGIEIAIPLDALGGPTELLDLTAFIGSSSSADVSNQIAGPIAAFFNGNLAGGRRDPNGVLLDMVADVRALDFGDSRIVPHAPLTIDLSEVALGACCTGTSCSIETPTDCANMGGTYQGDNVPCHGDYPCDGSIVGRCCIDDGFSGMCMVLTEADCMAEAGYVDWTAGETCDGCPCYLPPKGACCLESSCVDAVTESECIGLGGEWADRFSICDDNPCQFGIPAPHVVGSMTGWDPINGTPMTETAPGSGIWEASFTGLVPSSEQEFKITNNLDWNDPNHVQHPGANSWAIADPNGDLLITYDTNLYDDGYSPTIFRLPLPAYSDPGTWTFTGSFLTELGGAYDWINDDPLVAMTDNGDNTYSFTTDALPVGNYEGKPVVTGSWRSISWDARSVNTANTSFEIVNAGDTLSAYVDPVLGVMLVEVIAAPSGCPGDCDCDGDIDYFDINYFLQAINGEQAWIDYHVAQTGSAPTCTYLGNCDVDQDGSVDYFDINPFLNAIGTSCP